MQEGSVAYCMTLTCKQRKDELMHPRWRPLGPRLASNLLVLSGVEQHIRQILGHYWTLAYELISGIPSWGL